MACNGVLTDYPQQKYPPKSVTPLGIVQAGGGACHGVPMWLAHGIDAEYMYIFLTMVIFATLGIPRKYYFLKVKFYKGKESIV